MQDIIMGPSGGLGGHEFANYAIPIGAKLKEIHVFARQYVDAIQFVYQNGDGAVVTMPRIGGDNGEAFVFTLEENEYLTGISGLYDWYVDCIRFHTNKRVSEAFGGSAAANEFHFVSPDGFEIFGLFGRADWYVDAIGILARTHADAQPAAAEAPTATTAAVEAPIATAAVEAPAAEAPAAEAPASAAPAVPAVARTPKPKDLEKIEGIGPKIATLLVDNGVIDLADLANASVEQLRTILKGGGARLASTDPSSWPEQAALGVKGDWDGLKALQQQIKASKR